MPPRSLTEARSDHWRRPFLLVVLVVVSLGVLTAACGGDDDSDVNKVVLETRDFAYFPAQFTIPAGDVTIELRNTDVIEHDWRLDVGGPHIEAGPGQTRSATMTFDPGVYHFTCTIPGHLEAGMEGLLTVE